MVKILRNVGPKLTLGEINDWSSKNGVSLPREYINFLLMTNGGSHAEFDMYIEPDYSVQRLLSINPNDPFRIDIDSTMKRLRNRIPNMTIPIARSSGGDIYCISLDADSYGNIYEWRHEDELLWGDRVPTLADLGPPVAQSIDDFLDRLKPVT